MKTDFKIKKGYNKLDINMMDDSVGVTNENHLLFKTSGIITPDKKVFVYLNNQETVFLGYVYDQIDQPVFVDVYMYDPNTQGSAYVYNITNKRNVLLTDDNDRYFRYNQVLDLELLELIRTEDWCIEEKWMGLDNGYFIDVVDIIRDLGLKLEDIEDYSRKHQAEILFKTILKTEKTLDAVEEIYEKDMNGGVNGFELIYYDRLLTAEVQRLARKLLIPDKLIALYVKNKQQGCYESDDLYVRRLASMLRIDDPGHIDYLKQVVIKFKTKA